MKTLKWENFSHDADIGIRGFGKTMEEAFATAVLALTAVVTDPHNVSPQIKLNLKCEEADAELLFFDWINTVIYEMDTKNLVFADARVHIKNSVLEGELWGEIVTPEKHDPATEIKGATMTELKVGKINGGWIAQCVVDV
ncbi:MAG: hypothetical protein A2X86_11085 [Bdellovibrionales bacterium GWA2_49_15]|nr:MAG: hypothetical protein A2X86_11085 [Bdellovibrionales bacterium GWA2_49_15]HAZ12706.1 hypothetical protein [Bdellovibrionales bacterium]